MYTETNKERIKDYSGALDDYNKVIELEPNSYEIYYDRGNKTLLITF